MVFCHVSVEPCEAAAMLDLADQLNGEVDRLDSVLALQPAVELSTGFPSRVRDALTRLRSADERVSTLLITGADLGPLVSVPTPRSFGEHESLARSADCMMYLFARSIGTPYCFASQQRGSLVLDVIPLPGCEEDQLGCSSMAELEWHNEDAFHPFRADYTILMCLRNEQRAATRVVFIDDIKLAPDVLDQLRQHQFTILPDISHSHGYNLATSGVADGNQVAFERIERSQADPSRMAVLTGDEAWQQICVDFAYMPAKLHSDAANAALGALRLAIEQAGRSVVLTPGDILILDNRRCVHGRDSFGARYDGTDRWLRRLNVARDRSRVAAHQMASERLCIA